MVAYFQKQACRGLQRLPLSWHRLGNALCRCSSVEPAKAVPEHGPKSSAIDFADNKLRMAFGSDCQMTCRVSNFNSNLNSAAWPTSYNGLTAPKSLNKLCGIWILFWSIENAKIGDSNESLPTLISGSCQGDDGPHPRDWALPWRI